MTTRPRSEAHVGFHDVSDFESWIFDSAGHEIFFQILLVQVLADKHLGFFKSFFGTLNGGFPEPYKIYKAL